MWIDNPGGRKLNTMEVSVETEPGDAHIAIAVFAVDVRNPYMVWRTALCY